VKWGKGSTYTDAQGVALLQMEDGDTLYLKRTGFRDTSLVVSCNHRDVKIFLEPVKYVLPEVVVEKSIGENISTRPTRAIGREEILFPSTFFLRPDDLLEQVPGVFFVGKDPTASVPAVRGLAFFRTLVIVDAIRLSTEREIGPSLFFAPTSIVRAVEVAEGGGTPFGSDAIGGTVIYLLKGVGDPNEVSLSLKSNPRSFSLYLAHTPLDSLYVGVASSSEGNYTFPDTLISSGLWGRGALRSPSSNRKFASIVEWRKRGYSLKGAFFSVVDFHRAYSGSVYYPRIDHIFLSFSGRYISVGYHGYGVLLRKVKDATVKENLRTGRDLNVRFQYDLKHLHLGLSYFGRLGVKSVVFENNMKAYDEIDDGYSHDLGMFAFGEMSRSDVLLSYGARLGFYTASNSPKLKLAPALHVGFRYSLKDWSLSMNVERAYRFPTLSETDSYSPHPRGFLLGNPNLKPEESLGGDLSLRWSSGASFAEIVIFNSLIYNYIELAAADTLSFEGDTIFTYINLPGKTNVFGVEFRGKWTWKGYNLEVTYTKLGGRAGIRVPPSYAHFKIGKRVDIFTLSLKGKYQPAIAEVADVEKPRPSYLLLGLEAKVKYGRLNFSVGINNLLNSVAYATLNPKSYPLPGRGAFLNVRYLW